MVDPICRWRNTTVKQVCEFSQILPHKPMPKNEAREQIEKNWNQWDGGNSFFRTPYQLAAQLGLYYEDEDTLYPRFDHVATLGEAEHYIREWLKRYYVPNPYTVSIKYSGKPIVLTAALQNAIKQHAGGIDLQQFFGERFNIELGNIDIISNLLTRFSCFECIDGKINTLVEGEETQEESDNSSFDKKAFFETFDGIEWSESKDNTKPKIVSDSLQQISYGAPGTGKSHGVKEETEAWEKEGRVVRTTFHPDSDYSTFVGAYKPTTQLMHRYDMYQNPIIDKVSKEPVMEQVITYEFVPQAFLQAYVDAWKDQSKSEYLVIEEINRGNCAQIFGDLFQLLDRGEDGFSEYAIRADRDLQKYLADAFADVDIDNENVKSGKELLLPSNLFIRATMNTSDQSLFPIDSAFKRRWDWQYMPISDAKKHWTVAVGDTLYDWWDFVSKINKRIFDATNSEDKQLGYFFCKAKDGVISIDAFVGKVVFYLWNDVFKDFGFDDAIFNDKDDTENPKLSFDKFYAPNGKAKAETVKTFMENLGVVAIETEKA